jgi:hypothetical protein
MKIDTSVLIPHFLCWCFQAWQVNKNLANIAELKFGLTQGQKRKNYTLIYIQAAKELFSFF